MPGADDVKETSWHNVTQCEPAEDQVQQRRSSVLSVATKPSEAMDVNAPSCMAISEAQRKEQDEVPCELPIAGKSKTDSDALWSPGNAGGMQRQVSTRSAWAEVQRPQPIRLVHSNVTRAQEAYERVISGGDDHAGHPPSKSKRKSKKSKDVPKEPERTQQPAVKVERAERTDRPRGLRAWVSALLRCCFHLSDGCRQKCRSVAPLSG